MADRQKNSSISTLHNLEAEQTILGAILLRPQVLEQVSEKLCPSDFYRPDHRLIFQTMMDLAARAEPLDLVTVTVLLKEGVSWKRWGELFSWRSSASMWARPPT